MTEKNYNPEQKQRKSMKKQEKFQKAVDTEAFKSEKSEIVEDKDKKIEEKVEASGEVEKKQEKKIKEKPKKTKSVVNGFNVPISTKQSAAICRFIKRKKIQQAIKELEEVVKIKKSIPMKGEIPHRKGKMMSGRFPEKAAKHFIILLKSLASNSIQDGLEDPIIVEAVANIGARPFGRAGIRRKRTHIKIVAENKTKEKTRLGVVKLEEKNKNEK
ncbi:MAG: uL22 family ribosomal protein [Nanoarchaeota archaeon]